MAPLTVKQKYLLVAAFLPGVADSLAVDPQPMAEATILPLGHFLDRAHARGLEDAAQEITLPAALRKPMALAIAAGLGAALKATDLHAHIAARAQATASAPAPVPPLATVSAAKPISAPAIASPISRWLAEHATSRA